MPRCPGAWPLTASEVWTLRFSQACPCVSADSRAGPAVPPPRSQASRSSASSAAGEEPSGWTDGQPVAWSSSAVHSLGFSPASPSAFPSSFVFSPVCFGSSETRAWPSKPGPGSVFLQDLVQVPFPFSGSLGPGLAFG